MSVKGRQGEKGWKKERITEERQTPAGVYGRTTQHS
jgi:hypothetical protein